MATEHKGTGRKDTGRTDEFSDESPAKDYADYIAKHGDGSKKNARANASFDDPAKHHGEKSVKVKTRELQGHIEQFEETFNQFELNEWDNKLQILTEALKQNNYKR